MVEHVSQRGEGRLAVTGPLLQRQRLVVRFSDCDPLAHVNNAVYLTYLEQARITLWRAQLGGWPWRDSQNTGRREGFILARAEVDFRAQAREGDELEVRLALAGFGRTSATYAYEIVNAATGALVAEAKTVQVWIDYEAGRPLALTDSLKAQLSTAVDAVAHHR
jgi:acyl-CoA thioester hydrolase